jgi:hypothetical protein
MGNYLTAGHSYIDGDQVNAANLNEHVNEAVIKPTAISTQVLKDPAVLSDQLLINDGGTLKRITLEQIYNLTIQAGTVVQTLYGEYTANANITSIIPVDDTIPQNTEGTEILAVSITPRFATSTILCRFQGQGQMSVVGSGSAALFRGATIGAIAANRVNFEQPSWLGLEYMDSPATTSSTTYRIRVGPSAAGTLRLNGSQAARAFGGVARATLLLSEIKV